MALLNIDDDPWLLEYDSCKKLQRDIMEQLNARNEEPRSSDLHAKLSANIRIRLKQFNNEVDQLKRKLEQSIDGQSSITYDEIERRNRQVEFLKSQSIQMDRMFNNLSTAIREDRRALLGSSDDELLDSESYNIEQLKKQKQEMLQRQNEGLDNLSKIIARQKDIAETITTEVDLHNDIIDDLGDHIARTDVRVHAETENVGLIDRRDNTCVYWIAIILLFISILVVATAF